MRDYEFYIHAMGTAENPTVVFLHGFMGSGPDWLEVSSELTDQYYCLAPDLPGHGRTRVVAGEDAFGMRAIAETLEVVLTRLNLKQVDLVGYSMGGRLALYFALWYRERVRRLVLESASPGLADEAERAARREQDEALAKKLETEPLGQFLQEWYAQPMFETIRQDPERFAKLLERRGGQDASGLAQSLRGMGTGVQEPLWEELGTAPPTLLIVGEEDAKFREIAARMAAAIPEGEVATIAGAGHNVHFEQPKRFAELVKEFLGRKKGSHGDSQLDSGG